MRSAFVALFLLVVTTFPVTAPAGPHAGGTLVVHALHVEYSAGEDYCQFEPPVDCESVSTRVKAPVPMTWVVYAVFLDAESPRLRGIEFGVSYSSGIGIVDSGHCADFELVTSGWPASGTGTIIVWNEAQTGRLIPAYWFAGYTYAAGGGVSFQVGPHPESGGHFGDDSIVPVLDEIAGYGVLGFGAEGEAPCPRTRVFTIRPDGSGDVPTIADAIRVAAAGSVIELEDGVYRGDGNRDLEFNHTPLTLRSISGDPAACIIDCQGAPGESHRGIRVGWLEDTHSLVSGIKFINGYAGDDLGTDAEGGAIKIDDGGSLRIENCEFENCIASNAGGAVDCAGLGVEMIDCVFQNNHSLGYQGGGFSGGGRVVMQNCRFEGNTAPVEGGGAWTSRGTLEVEGCVFANNRAPFGGGMMSGDASGRISHSTWLGNEATQSGGGLYCRQGEFVIEHATFSGNVARRGAALVSIPSRSTKVVLRRSIVAFSEGGAAIDCGRGVFEAWQCDVWGNSGPDWSACLQDPLAARGNFSADPLFCDRELGDLTLQVDSPCATRPGLDPSPIGAWPADCDAGGSDHVASAAIDLEPAICTVFPNPFQFETAFGYSVPPSSSSERVRLVVFDTSGRVIRSLVNAPQPAGPYSVAWDGRDNSGRDLPAGSYFSYLTIGNRTEFIRVVRVR